MNDLTLPDEILLLGGVNYNEAVEPNSKVQSAHAIAVATRNSSLRSSRGTAQTWTHLPGTSVEIQRIATLLHTQTTAVDSLSGKRATEAAFKQLSAESPAVLHIATHGFFYENHRDSLIGSKLVLEQNKFQLANDPLLRSGLVLAGANSYWGKRADEGVEDGILTAMEISNLDLSATDLVVLSACETGLGDVEGSEGVYGLQRAFKMAGVTHLIMSLWQVPDAETAAFMELLYGEWIDGNSLNMAFVEAQRQMAKKYKNEPFKWAAFVLIQ